MNIEEAIVQSQPIEHTLTPTTIEGAVPADLDGTLLRAGPGLLEVGPDSLNFFDGHALIAGTTFSGGTCTFRSRFVRTPLYETETQAGRMLKRRTFTNLPARWSNLGNVDLGNNAMHDVLAWGDRVIAGNDPGHFALDRTTLATRGRETWGGSVKTGARMGPMPYPDPATGRLIGWTALNGGTKPDKIAFVELDEDFKVVIQTPFHALDRSPAIVHDQRATEHFYVAVQQALRIDPLRALWGAASLWESQRYGGHATLLVVPRGREGALVRIDLPQPVQIGFHVINAYEDGDKLIVDLVTYDGVLQFSSLAPAPLRERLGLHFEPGPLPTPRRFVVDPAGGKLLSSARLTDAYGEAPEVRDDRMGRPYRYAYLSHLGRSEPVNKGGYFLFGGIAKLDVTNDRATTWSDAKGCLVSPPAFVARPNSTDEDDGWLLAYVLDTTGQTTDAQVVVLDARAIEAGPVARVHLGIHLPAVSHTRWAPSLHLDGPA